MQRIAIDMDEVIADANHRFSEWYERDFNVKVIPEPGKYFKQCVPESHFECVRNYITTEGFFKDMKVIEDSQEIIKELMKKYEIFITTAAMEFPTSFVHKYEWLKEHFPFIHWSNIVFCGDKSILNADYLIDDHSYHFKRFRGQGILFTSPHNINESWNPRVNSWKEIGEMFL